MDVCQISSTSKGKLRSLMRTQWPIFVKLGMWVVGDTSTTHMVCCHRMCTFNTSFAYLFWLANNKQIKYPGTGFCMGYIDETWYVGSDGHKYYHVVCRHQMRIFNTSFAYLFQLANEKNEICNNWYAHVKSNFTSLSTSTKGGPRCIFCEYSERVS